MKTLHRAVRRPGAVGVPLPHVFPSFQQARIQFRRHAFSMVAGMPGNYKSTLVQNMCAHWARRDADCAILYVAADADDHQVGSLMAAMVTGDPMERTETGIRNGQYDDALATIAGIEWEFHPLGRDAISERMEAMWDKWGKYPDLVVVDNVMNVVAGPGDWKGQLEMSRDLKQIALDSGSHVMVLHHTQEHPMKASQVGFPPPRWDIHGKVAQFPTLILTVATAIDKENDYGVLRVAPVKNRTGPDDLTGNTFIEFNIQPSNGRVWEIPEAA